MSFFDRILRSLENFFTSREVEDEPTGWYFSGLQYEKDIGVTIFGDYTIEEAEEILRDYARSNIRHYNDDFYGIAEIEYNEETLDMVEEVNL